MSGALTAPDTIGFQLTDPLSIVLSVGQVTEL